MAVMHDAAGRTRCGRCKTELAGWERSALTHEVPRDPVYVDGGAMIDVSPLGSLELPYAYVTTHRPCGCQFKNMVLF
jgi:hypothetical protein